MPATAAVTADYVHREKRATPREGMTVGKSRLKWSNIGYADAPVPAEIEALARDHVSEGRRGRRHRLRRPASLRRRQLLFPGGADLARPERGVGDRLRQDRPRRPGFKLWTYKTAHRGTFCVWELGVVWHEKQAWVRFLNSSRGETDLQRYLDDRYEGVV